MPNGRKQFSKDKCHIPHDIVVQFCKETEKQYREIDCNGLLSYMCEQVEDFQLPISTMISAQQQTYGYISYTDPSRQNTAVVTDVNCKYTPRITLYRLDTGSTMVAKLKKKSYEAMPIPVGSIIDFRLEKKNKWRKENDQWVQINEYEDWLSFYSVESYG